MPRYDFSCACGGHVETNVSVADRDELQECPLCLQKSAVREFGVTTRFSIAPWLSDEGFEARARHREWLGSDEVKAGLKSGRYDTESGSGSTGVRAIDV